MSRWVYPGNCDNCGMRWGMHVGSLGKAPGACTFVPKPGELSSPKIILGPGDRDYVEGQDNEQ